MAGTTPDASDGVLAGPDTDTSSDTLHRGVDGQLEMGATSAANGPPQPTADADTATGWPDAPEMPTHEQFAAPNKAANAGDAAALANLRELLDNHATIWQQVGDLSAHAEHALVNLIAGGNQLLAESLYRGISDLKAQLGPTGPANKLDELAVGRVVATWLHLQHIEQQLIHAPPASREAAHLLKWQAQTSRQFDAAVKSLTTLRQLVPRPAVAAKHPPRGDSPGAHYTASAATTATGEEAGPMTIPMQAFPDAVPTGRNQVFRQHGSG